MNLCVQCFYFTYPIGLLEAVEKIHIQWAVVKAASDFADGSKDLTDSWQRFSSAMAASVVHNIFKNDVMRKWPRAHDGMHSFIPKLVCSSQFNCSRRNVHKPRVINQVTYDEYPFFVVRLISQSL